MSTENCVSTKPKIRVIPAKPRQLLLNPLLADGEMPKLRVAAYARVSTDHEEQESNYEAQVAHFTKLIKEHDDWELAGIFADPGLSGKNVKRKEFQKMMEKCESGKESSEFVLTIMASLAEEESRSISNNIRWSVKKRFENGKVIMTTAHFLGYTKDENGALRIVPEQAITVRRIYAEFLDGFSLKEIADGLMRDNIPSPSGKPTWHATTVKSILQNEKYKGDSHLQKTYLPDFLSPKRIKNEGQADSYYVEDSHAAIVSKETFEMVQQEFVERNELRSSNRTGHGKYSGKYAFSGMIICGECGETYRRHQQYNPYKKYYTWVCKRHENTGKNNCPAKPMKEKAIEDAFLRAVNGLITNGEQVLEKLRLAAVGTMSDSCESQTAMIDERIQKCQESIARLLKDKQEGRISQEEYNTKSRKLMFAIDELNLKRQETLTEQSKMQLAEYRADAVTELLKNGKLLDEFDKTIFKSLVRRITVVGEKEIEIEFECGIKARENVN